MNRKRTALSVMLSTLLLATACVAATANADESAAARDFYADPKSNAYAWLDDNPDDPAAESIRSEIAEQASAKWYGDWEPDTSVTDYVAAAAAKDQTPILVAYNMYQRDCNGESGGGADSPQQYRDWIAGFAAELGDSDAIVVVEPDAVAQLLDGCVADPQARRELLAYAVDQLSAAPNASVYLDAGNAAWPEDVTKLASELDNSGIAKISGFAMNVSNHYTTKESTARATEITAALDGDAGYVIDTSRNGAGKTDPGEDGWCNPIGATLGENSSDATDGSDAHLWIKLPGDSDGKCGYDKDSPAGQFSPKLATALITGEYS